MKKVIQRRMKKNARYAKRSFGITQTIDWHKPIDRLAYAPKNKALKFAQLTDIN